MLQDVHGPFVDRSQQTLASQPTHSSPTGCQSPGPDISATREEYSSQEGRQQSASADASPIASDEQEHSRLQDALSFVNQDPSSKLKKFSGDLMQFQEWWDIFEIYVDSRHLRSSEKLRLLKESLEGRPRQRIQHLRVTDSLYEMARSIIKDRYENRSQAQSLHVHKIHRLCATMDLQISL